MAKAKTTRDYALLYNRCANTKKGPPHDRASPLSSCNKAVVEHVAHYNCPPADQSEPCRPRFCPTSSCS